MFEDYCPIYLNYGMTYEQYWCGDPWMARAYAQAYLLKRRLDNENAWLTGLYMTKAVNTAIANAFGNKQAKYFDKPLDIFPKTAAEKKAEIREERNKLANWLSKMQRTFKKNQ